ncbi:CBS domain-containing protein, partial [Klebsiella pneumoniae]|uniref:CBS domain-containing protein n=1 Tax=Klebsiella pneumoniae TaxID=573 RepID=UPI003F51F2E1
ERGLKRLALLPVSQVELSPGPVVDVEASAEEAREVMRRHGVDWVGLLDNGRITGWVHESELDGRPLAELKPKDFLVSLTPDSSL